MGIISEKKKNLKTAHKNLSLQNRITTKNNTELPQYDQPKMLVKPMRVCVPSLKMDKLGEGWFSQTSTNTKLYFS